MTIAQNMNRSIFPRSADLARLVVIVAMMLLPALLSACGNDKDSKAKTAKAPIVVTAAKAIVRTVPVQLRAIGNVEATATVQVRSLINGTITKVHIKDGDEVRKGDMLFTLDPRPAEAALAQAKAQLEKDRVQLRKAEEDARRYRDLVQKEVISRESFDQTETNAAALRAQIRVDEALVDKARLDLEYCFIRSPIDGKTGSVALNEGNVVKANADSAMLVIHQIAPIDVNFSVPEDYLPEVQKRMAEGKLKVLAFIGESTEMMSQTGAPAGEAVTGVLTYVDNSVDKTTGTIKLKATFDNKDRKLWPGRFVRVLLNLADRPDALLVDTRAIQPGQDGQFVYVVGPDMTVQPRKVKTADNFEKYTVVLSGLEPDALVVTDGQLRLTPNATVSFKDLGDANATARPKTE